MSELSNQPGAQPPSGTRELPSTLLATPADVADEFNAETPFWLPSPIDSLKLLGWRWVFVIAAAAFVAGFAWLCIFRGRYLVLSFSGLLLKLGVFAIGGLISLWIYLRRGAIRLRKEPFCIHCGYSLAGLADGGTCPECGRKYLFRVSEEYKRDPHWFIERYRGRAHAEPAGFVLDVPRGDHGPRDNPDGI